MNAPEEVILVHGLWMGPWVMHWMASQFEKAGYRATQVGIRTVSESSTDHLAHVDAAVIASRAPAIHLVGHSMGGVVLLRYLAQAGDTRLKRAVLLGTPALGSEAARQFHHQPWGGLLGTSQAIWNEGFAEVVDPRFEVGAIAGDLAIGLGAFFVSLPKPNDGAVSVAETRIGGLRDHIVLPVSHTGMLFSGEVARQATAFLNTGCFAK